jgi:hypothetical protein
VSDSISVAKACFEAYVRKDRATIERIIDENFHFTSPLDNRIDRKTYFERCWPNSDHIAGFTFIHLVPHGDQVFVTYEGTGNDGKGFRNTEILRIQNGRVVDVEVFFGRTIPHKAEEGGYVDSAG